MSTVLGEGFPHKPPDSAQSEVSLGQTFVQNSSFLPIFSVDTKEAHLAVTNVHFWDGG